LSAHDIVSYLTTACAGTVVCTLCCTALQYSCWTIYWRYSIRAFCSVACMVCLHSCVSA